MYPCIVSTRSNWFDYGRAMLLLSPMAWCLACLYSLSGMQVQSHPGQKSHISLSRALSLYIFLSLSLSRSLYLSISVSLCIYLSVYQRKQVWMKRLKTLAPHGLNERQEQPTPIHFNDHAYIMAKLLKTIVDRIQERCTRNHKLLQHIKEIATYVMFL